MPKITEAMKKGIKDSMAVVIAETTGSDVKEVREWLDTVHTAQDFFGTNKQGLREYEQFINQRESEYNRAQRRALSHH